MSEDDAMRDYLQQVELVPRLTERELRELGEAMQASGEADDLAPAGIGAGAGTARAEEVAARGQAARKRLIEGSLRLVVAVAEDYRDQGLSFTELLQAGNVGLVRAVERFDWRRSVEFPRHAVGAIREAITAALADRE
jgi:RNA polymerase primary sigma factor